MKRIILHVVLLTVLVCCKPAQRTWIAIGDSITYLNDHPDETGNRITKGYMTRVVEQSPDLRYVNKGYNGWTAGNIARDIDTILPATDSSRADVFTVFLGTNDWWRGRPLGSMQDYEGNTGNETFFGSYRIIMDKLRLVSPDATIILITPMQRVDFVYIANMKNNAYGSYREKNGQTLEQFANAIIEIGNKEGIRVLDLYHESGMTHENLVKFKHLKDPASGAYRDYPYPEFVDIPFNPETDEYPYPPEAIDMTYDGLHPSDKGYEVIAELLLNMLR